MEWSSTNLRVLRAVAERSSFTAAADALGYTQSAVSRQIAALEHSAGTRLFERRPAGVVLTAAGKTLLRHAAKALDELDQADRVLKGGDTTVEKVRLGFFDSAGAVLVPEALVLMADRCPHVEVITREGSSLALVRSLRAATLDVALIGARPPYPPLDDEDPPLKTDVLLEGEMLVAVPSSWASRHDGTVSLEELRGVTWISGMRSPGELGFGAWPALPERAMTRHRGGDWLTRLALVAHGHGALTLPPIMIAALPAGVRALRVLDGPPVERRILLARRADRESEAASALTDCLRAAAMNLPLT